MKKANQIKKGESTLSKAYKTFYEETQIGIDEIKFQKVSPLLLNLGLDFEDLDNEHKLNEIKHQNILFNSVLMVEQFYKQRDERIQEKTIHEECKAIGFNILPVDILPEPKFYSDLLDNYKPNLIPNNKDGFNPLEHLNGTPTDYIISEKLDGVCCTLLDGNVLGRSLKPIKNIHIQRLFKMASMLFFQKGIIVHGEIYKHNTPFNAIESYCNTVDVTSSKHRADLIKERDLNKDLFIQKYGDQTLEDLTKGYQDYKLFVFDCFVIENPDLSYEKRMKAFDCALYELKNHSIAHYYVDNIFDKPQQYKLNTVKEIESTLNDVISRGGEGLVLSHKDRKYKFGKHTLKSGEYFKLKNNQNEYDGQIIDIVEGTKIKPGVKTTINELGRSVTSKKKDDRIPSGMAKGFKVLYNGEELIVMLKSYNEAQKKDLLTNKAQYIGRWIKYNAMPPIKLVPRHAVFDTFRDDK